ncbi:MAG: M24 family metallopeptidase, partial [Treponemataceae bacterium]|nr:M24 family metallopeptidase [Treponemataceae bacterium]
SPQCGGVWGDFARTIVIESGRAADCEEIASAEWKRGIAAEKMLHAEMCRFVSPRTTFAELHWHMNEAVVRSGFVNLDFKGNLGHSIARRKEERIYIEEGNGARLGDVPFFTFEPHIGAAGSPFGSKREDIYYFDGGELRRL